MILLNMSSQKIYFTLLFVIALANASNGLWTKRHLEKNDPCSMKACTSEEVCVVDETENEALCVDKSRITTLDSQRTRKRNIAQPKVYYPGVCGIDECRYGECEIYNSTYFRCHCTKGVTGEKCDQLDISGKPCSTNPCYGDSKCYNVRGDNSESQFLCVCSSGRAGLLCEGHKGQCQCGPNGVCRQLNINEYACDCLQPYGGHICQYYLGATEFCKNQPCQNDGTCTWQSTCKCKAGFTGTFCENEISATQAPTASTVSPDSTVTVTTTQVPKVLTTTPNICTDTICKNGGICYQFSSNIAFCQCQSGFSGPFCEISAVPDTTTTTTTTSTTTTTTTAGATESEPCPAAVSNPCQNGGACTVVGANIVCQCQAPYSGAFCLDQQPFCESSPCQNGAECLPRDELGGFCVCKDDNFQGKFCEVGLICNENPCQNSQQCLEINGSPRCFCNKLFTGTFCETPV